MRPYNDSEVADAIARLIKSKNINDILTFLYSERNEAEVLNEFKQINTVSEFQNFFSDYAVKEILKKTSDGLTTSGLENVDPKKACLFIANHRDIVLDSAIMQTILLEGNMQTSQITFGENLMSNDFIIDLGKLNKMFTFYRGGSNIKLYRNAKLHSEYIRKVITKENESVWIAQRDGRTKNGDDKTQLALIKMLAMCGDNAKQVLMDLNIVPVVVSYEYEPCDAQKVQELYHSKAGSYKKAPGEDLNSILSGIKGYKGQVHMAFGTPLNKKLSTLNTIENDANGLFDQVIKELDTQVYQNFELWPNNYIAVDILAGRNKYLNKNYTKKQKDNFVKYIANKISDLDGDIQELENLFLKLYAMPVNNAACVKKETLHV